MKILFFVQVLLIAYNNILLATFNDI